MSFLKYFVAAISIAISVGLMASLSFAEGDVLQVVFAGIYLLSVKPAARILFTKRVSNFICSLVDDGFCGALMACVSILAIKAISADFSYFSVFIVILFLVGLKNCLSHKEYKDCKNSLDTSLVFSMNLLSVLKDTLVAMMFVCETMTGFSFESLAWYWFIKLTLNVVGFMLDLDTYKDAIELAKYAIEKAAKNPAFRQPITPSNYIGYTDWIVLWTIKEEKTKKIDTYIHGVVSIGEILNIGETKQRERSIYEYLCCLLHGHYCEVAHPP